jgi:hypothetical protein
VRETEKVAASELTDEKFKKTDNDSILAMNLSRCKLYLSMVL